MRYIALNLLVCLTILSLIGLRFRMAKPGRRLFWVLGMLLLLTAIFDPLIVSTGIVAYDSRHILGVYIGRAPVEDFFYAVVAAVMAPLLWDYYEHKK